MADYEEILLPWDSQPQEVVELNRDLGITPEFVWLGSNPSIDLVSGRLWTRGTLATDDVKSFGRGTAFGNTSTGFSRGGGATAPSGVTIVAVMVRTAAHYNYSGYFITSGTNAGVSLTSRFGFDVDIGWTIRGVAAYAGVTTPLNEPFVLVASITKNGTGAHYVHLRNLVTGVVTKVSAASATTWNAGDGTYRVFRGWDNSAPVSGGLMFGSLDYLPESLADQYLNDPWGMLFAPQSICVPVSAGGGASTHDTTGALAGAGSAIAGSAAHIVIHGTSGALTGQGSSVVGSAARTRAHPTSGALTGPGSVVDGAAVHNTVHPTSGALVGPGSEIDGAADHVVPGGTHDTTGALTGQGAVIAGTAAHVAIHGTTGVLVGAGAVLDGAAERVGAAVSHDTTGALVGMGAAIVGAASWVAFGPEALGSLVGSTRKTMQSRPARVMSSSRPAAIQRGRR